MKQGKSNLSLVWFLMSCDCVLSPNFLVRVAVSAEALKSVLSVLSDILHGVILRSKFMWLLV